MDNKNLPIRVFQKREIDTRETEGSGGKDPSWVLTGSDLRSHASQLTKDCIHIHTYFDSPKSAEEDPVPISVSIIEKAIAKSYREEIERIFVDDKNNYSTVGFTPDDNLMFLIKSREHIRKIDSNLASIQKNRKGISAISKIQKYKPYVEENIDLDDSLKIKLIDYKNDLFRKRVHQHFREYCENIGVALKEFKYTKTLSVYKASNVTRDSINSISSFNGVFSVESMPKYGFTYDKVISTKRVEIKSPVKDKEYPIIGILDSGIAKIDHLSEWIYGEKSPYIEEELDRAHGTFVAGIALYGDELIDKKVVDCDGCYLFDAPVISDFNLGKIEEAELIDNIREVVNEKGDDIKIWSLSLGTSKPASLHYFSDFGIALDEIQEEHQVLIIKSAGNCRNFESSKSPSRISISADSVRSIVVGSIAHDKCETDIAEVNCLSPFSRVGPGPQHITKPDLIHYGGNSGLSATGKVLNNGVLSFNDKGEIISDCGTSFSAPRVSALAAELNHNLSGGFDRILLKTLLLHSAKYPTEIQESHSNLIKKYGFGLPLNTKSILFNDDYEITIILKDELPKGQYIEILDFPYPSELINSNGDYYGEVTVTLVNDCLLDRTQGKEYCQSELKVALGTYDSTVKRDTSKHTIKNPIGRKESKNLLNMNLYSKRPKAGLHLREPLLIQNGKFHPVKKFVCDFDKMTKTNIEKHLTAPKNWYLRVDGVYRENTERAAIETGIDLKNRFCLAITIRDPIRENKVYNSVAQLLTQRNFLHNQLEIRQDVRLRVKQES